MMSEHSLTPYTHKKLKMAQRLKYKMGHRKTLRREHRQNILTLGQSPKATEIKAKIN